MSRFTLIRKSTATLPRVAFAVMAKKILGPKYSLSLVITTPAHMRKLNLIYRNKNKPTDILSFPLSKTEGEMYICPSEARKEMKKFDRTYKNFLGFLFIHGCVHLIGYDHSATMEGIEAKWRVQLLQE